MNNISMSEAEFNRLVKAVENGIKNIEASWVQVWTDAGKVRDSLLWKKTHKTWTAFCDDKWHIARRTANQSIKSAVAVQQLTTQVSATSPALLNEIPNISERVGRAIADVPAEHRKEVVTEVVKRGPITAKAVVEAARPIQMSAYVDGAKETEPEEVVELDKTGYPVPDQLVELWKRNEEVQRLLSILSGVKGRIKIAQDAKDALFTHVNFTRVLAEVQNAYTSIKQAMSFAVCPSCKGWHPDRCDHCRGKGFLNEQDWQMVPVQTRMIREAMATKSST